VARFEEVGAAEGVLVYNREMGRGGREGEERRGGKYTRWRGYQGCGHGGDVYGGDWGGVYFGWDY